MQTVCLLAACVFVSFSCLSCPHVRVAPSHCKNNSMPLFSCMPVQALMASLLQLEMLQVTTLRLMEIMNEQNQVSLAPTDT